jgi:hypothetical protein
MGNPCSLALIGLVMMWSFPFVDLAFFCAMISTGAAWQVLRVSQAFPRGREDSQPELRLSG